MKISTKPSISIQSGISLLEVLVVIVLTGLVSTMLLQATTFTLAAFDKNKGYQNRYQRELLSSRWMRDSIEHLVASLDEEFSMNGSNLRLEGYSLAPLYKKSGELVRVEWSIDKAGDRQQLWYKEGDGKNLLMASWAARNASFTYIASDGTEYSQWPAGENEVGHVPAQVKLDIDDDLPDARRTILMANKIRLQPALDYRDNL
jgi:Tfp pilus assembly protein PilV